MGHRKPGGDGNMELISAAVVLYQNTREQITKVIQSYRPSGERLLFLIDNDPESSDQYEGLTQGEGITYIPSRKNLGYGRAHNIGIQQAIARGSTYHIVMNPDVCFSTEAIDTLAEYASEHSGTVCLQPKILYPDHRLQCLCKLLPTPWDLLLHRFLPNSGVFRTINERYILMHSGYRTVMNPPSLSGCFLFLRTQTLREHDIRFDERFFMYCEDLDLVRRLHRVGKTVFLPFVEITHDFGGASHKSLRMLLIHTYSAFLYFNKFGWFFDRERARMNRQILEEIQRTEEALV